MEDMIDFDEVGPAEWTKEWPTEPGYYWFYGQCFESWYKYGPEIHFVKVRISGDGHPIYITDGHFMYKEEGAMGYWQPVDMPAFPKMTMLSLPEIVGFPT